MTNGDDLDSDAAGLREQIDRHRPLNSAHSTTLGWQDPDMALHQTHDVELVVAVLAADEAQVRAALAAGANVNVHSTAEGADAASVLQLAVGHPSLVRMLLEAGADPSSTSASGWTPLMRACNHGCLESAHLLLDAGADLHARNDEGYTAYGRIPGTCKALLHLVAERGGTI